MRKLEELEIAVLNAKTATIEGRQEVVKACKELYNVIEPELYRKFGENALKDAYTDLCKGNFAEPFMCEKKKEKFYTFLTIYKSHLCK